MLAFAYILSWLNTCQKDSIRAEKLDKGAKV